MVRINIGILGISELKWMGMGKFNSDNHYIYYCGQESLRRNGIPIIVNKSPKCSTWVQSPKRQNDLFVSKANLSIVDKRVQNAVLGCNLKNDKMVSVHFQGKQFNITVIQVFALNSNAEEAEVEQFYEDL